MFGKGSLKGRKVTQRGKGRSNGSQVTKRTIKYLAVVRNKSALSEVLRNAPDDVIKKVCNIALNGLKGDVNFTPAQKKLFRRHGGTIEKLASRGASLASKRKLLVQSGGFAWIPALIATVAGALGGSLFGGQK
jgi:hypothetical protein